MPRLRYQHLSPPLCIIPGWITIPSGLPTSTHNRLQPIGQPERPSRVQSPIMSLTVHKAHAHPQGHPFILKIKNIERASMIGPQGTTSSTFLDLLGLKCPPPASSPNSGHSYPSPNLHVAHSPSSFLSLLKCHLGKASADHFT